jgi:D-arginine dehydrogenase
LPEPSNCHNWRIDRADVVIIGGGIAGLSLAAEVAELDGRRVDAAGDEPRAPLRIVLLEREWQLGYHSTGRSAAMFVESYGGPEIRALTRASRPIIDAIGAESGASLLRTRPLVWVAAEHQLDRLNDLLTENPELRRVDLPSARTLCPALRPEYVSGAAVERTAADIDVEALCRQYRIRAEAAGVVLRTAVGVETGEWTGEDWHLTTDRGQLRAARVVDAAGPWADAVAVRLGVDPARLSPLRQTVALATTDRVPQGWPMVADVGGGFYFRPESGGVLLSPADETPSPPADPTASAEDVALALDRINEATTLGLERVRTSWAGLRSFASDRNPVVGTDPHLESFFWYAGLGGAGIQTAPALARLGAALLLDEPYDVPDVQVLDISPARARPATLLTHL